MDERADRDLWASFPHDPRDPAVAPLRAADSDRDLIQSALSDAFADGRLDRDEYDERSSAVLGARTLGELPAYVADLIPDRPLVPARRTSTDLHAEGEAKWREERRNALLSFLGPTLICWVIWLLTSFSGDGFHAYWPWPIFVTLPTLFNAVRTLARHEDIVREEVRRLEKKRDKQLKAREKPDPDTP